MEEMLVELEEVEEEPALGVLASVGARLQRYAHHCGQALGVEALVLEEVLGVGLILCSLLNTTPLLPLLQ